MIKHGYFTIRSRVVYRNLIGEGEPLTERGVGEIKTDIQITYKILNSIQAVRTS
jgi:hypothetical protein